MPVGYVSVFDINDRLIQIFFCQIMNDDFAGAPELSCQSMCELLEKVEFPIHYFTCLFFTLFREEKCVCCVSLNPS